jgi:hypothetical protein
LPWKAQGRAVHTGPFCRSGCTQGCTQRGPEDHPGPLFYVVFVTFEVYVQNLDQSINHLIVILQKIGDFMFRVIGGAIVYGLAIYGLFRLIRDKHEHD